MSNQNRKADELTHQRDDGDGQDVRDARSRGAAHEVLLQLVLMLGPRCRWSYLDKGMRSVLYFDVCVL